MTESLSPDDRSDDARAETKRIGQALRRIRERNGLTMQQVGRHLGISYQQVQKWENGSNRMHAGWLNMFRLLYQCDWSEILEQQDLEDGPEPELLAASRRIDDEEILLALHKLADGPRHACINLIKTLSEDLILHK